MIRIWPILTLVLLVAPANVSADKYTVLVSSSPNAFTPADLSILVSDVVFWTWISGAHSVTADDGSFDSGIKSKPARYRRPFLVPGDVYYYCKLHGSPGGFGHAGVIRVNSRDWDGDAEGPQREPVPIHPR